MQSRHGGTNSTGKSSRPCTNQIIACSFELIDGRVADQYAHGFFGASLIRNRTERTVQQWHAEKIQDFEDYLESQEREHAPYKLSYICTTMIRDNRGGVGDVARAVGGSLVAPLIDPTHIQRYFGDLKSFGAVCR